MRPLVYSIDVTLDGCRDHGARVADEALHRHAATILGEADALHVGGSRSRALAELGLIEPGR